MVSQNALLGNREATFLEVVAHAMGGSPAVLCQIGSDRFYVTQDEWTAGTLQYIEYCQSRGIVTTSSPSRDKVALFRSLFSGREDVYAKGYWNTKNNRIGYGPVCSNEWATGICLKKEGKHNACATCRGRLFKPLDDATLIAHFKGESPQFKDVVGLYVMREDATVLVLVADFDKGDWKNEVLAYAAAGRSLGVDVAIERSRSGNGAHAWAFFSEPVQASTARNLGSLFITLAMAKGGVGSFSAYDRLFPTQDNLPTGGLGNLIALPLQGQAMRSGNSLFVDDDFEPYPDQWRFLSSVRKTSPTQIDSILANNGQSPLGELAFEKKPPYVDLKALQPFELEIPVSEPAVLPNSISVTMNNMLVIERGGIPISLQNRIRRLAAFGNPEFYRAQKMHQNVHGKARIVDLSVVDERTISIPRGCKKRLMKLLSEVGVTYSFEDDRFTGSSICVDFRGQLRPTQQEAANALLHHDCGILSAPTGFGKTVIGAYLIGTLKLRTLVIVPSTSLLSQWQERLDAFLDIQEEMLALLTKSGRKSRKKRPLIGQIGSGKNSQSGIVDIATYQSLTQKSDIENVREVRDLVRQYGLVICDECQHGAAPQLAQILSTVRASHVYGLSATPKRSDSLENILYMQCGPIVHRVDPKAQANEQGFLRLLRPRFTHIRLPKLEIGCSYNQVVDALLAHDARNSMIVADAEAALESGHRPLVLTSRKDHAALLADKIGAVHNNVFLLTGDGTARERREKLEQVAAVPAEECFAIVATGSYLGEGFDEPRLDTLIMASPISFEGVVTQYSGRLHRENEGKSRVVVVDYVDTSVPMLERMYKQRLKTYTKLGYELESDDSEAGGTSELGGSILDAGNYSEVLAADFSAAEKTVVLSVPYVNDRRLELVAPLLRDACERGVRIRIVVRKPQADDALPRAEASITKLRELGCTAELCRRYQSSLAIFDESTVWYGTLPILAFPQEDDCSLRFKNAEIAADLIEDIEKPEVST